MNNLNNLNPKNTKGRGKSSYGLTREQEREASRFLGRHVTPEKALLCLIVSLLTCASPMLLGLRLWNGIPEVVLTGLIGADGADDSMPRAVLVFGVPGLMCLLNLICHVQLWLHQKTDRIPPTPVRLLGRWGIPVLSVLLCCFWILRAAGEPVTAGFFLPCALALLLILSGARFFDCTRDSRFAFHLKRIEYLEAAWKRTHRLAGCCWMLAGLLNLVLFLWLGRLPWPSAIVTVLLLLSEFPAAEFYAKKLRPER